MAKTMKAAVVQNFGEPLKVQELPIPEPRAGQVVVRIERSGVCHTDLHAAHGDWPVKPTLPFVPGHEGAGYVAAVGDGVTRVKEGDRVGVPWLHTACGCCQYCIDGWETLCGTQQNTGYGVNGCFAEYVLADPAFVASIPDGLELDAAAPVLCAGVTVYKGIKETEARPGEWLVVSGIGGLGHMAVQYAKAMGLHVAAVDVAADKLELAKDLGAELTINAAEKDPVKVVQKAFGGAHGVLVTAVNRPAFDQAIGMLRKRGTASLVGLPPGTFELPIFDMVLSRKTIRGSIVGTRNDLSEALQFAADGQVHARFSTDKLENINEIFGRMLAGNIEGRVVLEV
jgi:propanol-preferring alcohol dehydrogenase